MCAAKLVSKGELTGKKLNLLDKFQVLEVGRHCPEMLNHSLNHSPVPILWNELDVKANIKGPVKHNASDLTYHNKNTSRTTSLLGAHCTSAIGTVVMLCSNDTWGAIHQSRF